jgi:hypothetical protein
MKNINSRGNSPQPVPVYISTVFIKYLIDGSVIQKPIDSSRVLSMKVGIQGEKKTTVAM